MNTKNSKTNEPHRFRLSPADKLDLKNPSKNMALASITHGKTSNQHTAINLKCQHQLQMMNLTFLMDHILLDIQDYFEFIIKKHETLAEKPVVQIYPNKSKTK